ncbi:hypothetical protein CYLTODRAFT_424475 [Cylindrobasidium torrendii FP15055 ss-10]|uniref:Ribosomal protein mS38 C-terminal domain-containing protein n=1 Tax=Cylindrobasidium torrendii FP15055 ss-10 TaxID=1314674 RepID=A0A0D7B3Y2_9AGAR|nr:hypothetical protein CYLTODRAFT_424475 [Cylindrobasidium torrendii FP15055 ss-10]
MSSFARLLQPLPAARRGYSSFFSSKPGGGRFFNSSRPGKPIAVASNTQNTAVEKKDVAEMKVKPEEKPTELVHPAFLPLAPSHPVVDSNTFKLHQFFSGHRPLLLLNDPNAILENAPAHLAHLFNAKPVETPKKPEWPRTTMSESMEGLEADVDTARQVHRALILSRVGSAASWNSTLHRLGLRQPENLGMKARLHKEYRQIIMDSVKRKRRQKMKKHKRKKRARAGRASKQRDRTA